MKPPVVNESLQIIIRNWLTNHSSIHVPDNPYDGANWWIALQEPADEYRDRPEQVTNRSGDKTGWITPYHDRVANNLKIFLALTEVHKAFVVAKIKSGIPYRGDDIEMFKMVCAESEKMKANSEIYISSAKVAARGYLRGQ